LEVHGQRSLAAPLRSVRSAKPLSYHIHQKSLIYQNVPISLGIVCEPGPLADPTPVGASILRQTFQETLSLFFGECFKALLFCFAGDRVFLGTERRSSNQERVTGVRANWDHTRPRACSLLECLRRVRVPYPIRPQPSFFRHKYS